MKKLSLFLMVMLASFALSACTKKSDLTSGVNSSNVASEALPAEALSVSAKVTSESNPSAENQNGSSQSQNNQGVGDFVEERAMIDETYRQNYQVALEDAQRALKGGAKFCGTIIKFYGAQLSSQNIEQFLFYNDDFSKDYYWLVELNSYGSVKKTRSFIARRDIASEIKCASNPTATLVMFSGAYEQFTKSEKFKLIDPGIIAQTAIYPMDTSWNIVVTDNAGMVSTNEIVNTSAAAASSSLTSTESVITPQAQKTTATTNLNSGRSTAVPQADTTDNLDLF